MPNAFQIALERVRDLAIRRYGEHARLHFEMRLDVPYLTYNGTTPSNDGWKAWVSVCGVPEFIGWGTNGATALDDLLQKLTAAVAADPARP